MSIIEASGTHVAGGCGCGGGGECGGGDPCAAEGPIGLERTRWFSRMLVGPDDLVQDQRHAAAARRRHNRLLHGWGVVCGLRVAAGKDPSRLVVEPGFALGPWGHDIVVPDEVEVDAVAEDMDGNARGPCGDVDPWCTPVRVARDPDRPLYLAIRYAECDTRPVRVFGAGCGCETAECEYSRTRDSYVLKLLGELPKSHRDLTPPDWETVLRCPEGSPRGCPPCPDEPWVVLADIVVSGDAVKDIDCARHRRHVVSFANLFYLCQPRPTNEPPTVTIDQPLDGAILPTAHEVAVEFQATATDPEDGSLTGAAVQWFDSHNTVTRAALGAGTTLSKTLSWDQADVDANQQTKHTVTVVATDSGGKTATDSVSVVVGNADKPPATVCHRVYVVPADSRAANSLSDVGPGTLRGEGRVDLYLTEFKPFDLHTIDFTPGTAEQKGSTLTTLAAANFGSTVSQFLTVYRNGESNQALLERAFAIVSAVGGTWGFEVSAFDKEAPAGIEWPVDCPFISVLASRTVIP